MIFPAEEEEFLPDIGFAQSAGAVPMAIERLRNENVLPGAEFRYSPFNTFNNSTYTKSSLKSRQTHLKSRKTYLKSRKQFSFAKTDFL